MVDIFALALSHGLLALAAIRLLSRPELDDEGGDGRAAKAGRRLAVRREMRVNPVGEGADGDA
jgi:hypothetical protein